MKKLSMSEMSVLSIEIGKKVKEVYSMPGGGKRVEKERYNQAGNIVSRKIKDTKINPR